MQDYEKPGATAEERARAIEAGCAGVLVPTLAITAALHAHARDVRAKALEDAAGVADGIATGARITARWHTNEADLDLASKWACAEDAADRAATAIRALIPTESEVKK